MLAALPVYALARAVYVKLKKAPRFVGRELVLGLFVLFLVGLLVLVFEEGPGYSNPAVGIEAARQRLQTGAGITLAPFATMRRFWYRGSDEQILINLLGNVLMFLPVGFCLPLLWQRWQRLWKVFFAGLFLTLFIEIGQLFVGRDTDVDDVLLNLLGAVLGYGIYKFATWAAPGLQRLAARRGR